MERYPVGISVRCPLANDARALLWMANQNSITTHVWPSRTPSLLQPDLCIFDLAPSRENPITLRQAALAVRALLDEFAPSVGSARRRRWTP
jgi:bifunctional non-homologous end joining protein LigD